MAKDDTSNSPDPAKFHNDPSHASSPRDAGAHDQGTTHQTGNWAAPTPTPMRGSQTGPLSDLAGYHVTVDPNATPDQLTTQKHDVLNEAAVFGETGDALEGTASVASDSAVLLAQMGHHGEAISAAEHARDAAEHARHMYQQRYQELMHAAALEHARTNLIVYDELRQDVEPVRQACTAVAQAVTTSEGVTVDERETTIILHEQVDEQLGRVLDVHIHIDPTELLQRLGMFLLHIWRLALRIVQVRMAWDQHAMVLGPFLPMHPAF